MLFRAVFLATCAAPVLRPVLAAGHGLVPPPSIPKADIRAESPTWQAATTGNIYGGRPFNDFNMVSARGHPRISEIYVTAGDPGNHLVMLGFGFRDLHAQGETLQQVFHGLRSKSPDTFLLAKDEFISKVEFTTWAQKKGKKHKTRLGWIKFYTQTGRTIECGSKYNSDPIVTYTNSGQPLLYMAGTSGHAIDSLTAFFIAPATY